MTEDERDQRFYRMADRVFDWSKSHEWTFDGLNWTDEQIAAVKAALLAMSDPPSPSGSVPTEQPETTVERHVDAVIDHLNKGRVVPRKVDELAGAVARARTDGAVGRAIGGKR